MRVIRVIVFAYLVILLIVRCQALWSSGSVSLCFDFIYSLNFNLFFFSCCCCDRNPTLVESTFSTAPLSRQQLLEDDNDTCFTFPPGWKHRTAGIIASTQQASPQPEQVSRPDRGGACGEKSILEYVGKFLYGCV